MKTKLMRRRYKSPQAFFDVSASSFYMACWPVLPAESCSAAVLPCCLRAVVHMVCQQHWVHILWHAAMQPVLKLLWRLCVAGHAPVLPQHRGVQWCGLRVRQAQQQGGEVLRGPLGCLWTGRWASTGECHCQLAAVWWHWGCPNQSEAAGTATETDYHYHDRSQPTSHGAHSALHLQANVRFGCA
jgi:hypothetical protein